MKPAKLGRMEVSMNPGDKVIATAFRDKELRRKVVQVIENTIIICKYDEWDAAQLENRSPRGVGFPSYSVKPERNVKSS